MKEVGIDSVSVQASFLPTMPVSCRLTLLALADENNLFRLYTDSDVREFLGGAVPEAEARHRVAALFGRQESEPVWAIRAGSANLDTFVGVVMLDTHHEQETQVSYFLLPEHQGRGYASQAVTAALAYAFATLGLTRVVAETQARNIRSIRLLERVGMRPERMVTRFGVEQCIYVSESPAA